MPSLSFGERSTAGNTGHILPLEKVTTTLLLRKNLPQTVSNGVKRIEKKKKYLTALSANKNNLLSFHFYILFFILLHL